jgi:hypothetical protein
MGSRLKTRWLSPPSVARLQYRDQAGIGPFHTRVQGVAMALIDFLVRRDDLTRTRAAETAPLIADDGEAIIRVDRFALTANNITYGVAGDMIGYWHFFPAPDGWGRIPVWGMGTVSVSRHPDLAAGTRIYGYLPMSNELKVKPEKITARGFADASAQRAALPVVYNQYTRVNADNGFDPARDNEAMVYRPLFTTSFVLDDYLADNEFFDAGTVILGSASSKTAVGLAFMLKRRGGVRIIGLTSAANRAFVDGTGLYDVAVTYDVVETLPLERAVLVDMAGNREVLSRVHHRLGDLLRASIGVGITHWETRDDAPAPVLPGPRPAMFFAPTQIVKRNQELGPVEYQRRIGAATAAFLDAVGAWVTIEEHPFSALDSVYRTVLRGAPPDRGYVVTV